METAHQTRVEHRTGAANPAFFFGYFNLLLSQLLTFDILSHVVCERRRFVRGVRSSSIQSDDDFLREFVRVTHARTPLVNHGIHRSTKNLEYQSARFNRTSTF